MKKRISVIAIAVLAILLTACSSTADFKYYDEFAKQNEAVKTTMTLVPSDHECMAINPVQATFVDELLGYFLEVKATLREEFGTIKTLDWERFEAADLYLCDDFSGTAQGSNGFFDSFDGKVYFRRSIALRGEQVIKELFCHELIHSLTSRPGEATTLLHEGLTEYVAQNIYPAPEVSAYYFPQQFAYVYVEACGVEDALSLFATDNAADQVGQAIGRPNAIYTIEPLLEATSMGYFEDEHIKVIIDVLAHYSNAMGVDPGMIEYLNEINYQGSRDKGFYNYIKGVVESRKEVIQ